jgi:hypothetical protein
LLAAQSDERVRTAALAITGWRSQAGHREAPVSSCQAGDTQKDVYGFRLTNVVLLDRPVPGPLDSYPFTAVLRITTFSGGKKEMTFEDKRQFPAGKTNNGNGAGTPHGTATDPPAPADAAEDPDELAPRVLRYIPKPPVPRDFGREQAKTRAGSQSVKSARLRQHLDCEPPWDILRARASFDGPAPPHGPWPDRFDIWPVDLAGYWPCPICDTPLVAVDRTETKVFGCVTCDTATFVHVKAPVVECPRHGRHEIPLPWARNVRKWNYLGTEPFDGADTASSALRDLVTDGGETEH